MILGHNLEGKDWYDERIGVELDGESQCTEEANLFILVGEETIGELPALR